MNIPHLIAAPPTLRASLHAAVWGGMALGMTLSTMASPYRDAVLADSPLAYYRFEETVGETAVDSSGNGRDGTYVNDGGLGRGSQSAHANLGHALDFFGGYLTIPNLGTHTRTSIEGWLLYQSNLHDCCTALYATNGWSTGMLHLNLARSGDVLEHAVNGDARVIVQNTDRLDPATWYHIVITNDSVLGQTRFYLNGVLVGDTGNHAGQPVVLGVNGAQIGAWQGTRLLDGSLDEIAIYDRVLSEDRVRAHYEAALDPGTPRIQSFTVSSAGVSSDIGIALPAGGGAVTLTWATDRATSVTIDQGALTATPTAAGSVVVTVTQDTRFTLTATNERGTTTTAIDALIAPTPLSPQISEFMARNEGAVRDGDGASPDWIEIYNPNPFPIDLAGLVLSDRNSHWPFPPSSVVPALGHFVVFASGRQTIDSAGNLHTNFALDNEGEYLGLSRADGTVLDAYNPTYPRQYANVSYGRHGTPPRDGYFLAPTPGASNSSGFDALLDKIDDTSFVFGRGFYTAPFNETITAKTPGASIIYTLDGSSPTETNGIRVNPPDANTPPSAVVRIEGATNTGVTTLRAIAWKDGSAPTNVDTQTYIFSAEVPFQSESSTVSSGWPAAPVRGQVFDYGMTPYYIGLDGGSLTTGEIAASLEAIPTLSLVTDMKNLTDANTGIYVNALQRGREWERPVSVEVVFPDGYVDPDGNTSGFQIDAGVRIRGGWSRNPEFFKHAFRLFFRGEYGDTKLRYPLFGKEGASEFDMVDLRSDSNLDWSRETDFNLGRQFTFVRDVFSRDTQGAMGQGYTRSRYYHLYLNGTYWGIYQTQERSEKSFGASYFGGDKEDYDVVKSSNHVGGFATEASDGTLDAFKELWDRAREIGLRDPSAANFFALEGRNPDGTRNPNLPVWLDVDNLIDYMLIIFWTGNGDGTLSSFLNNNLANNWFGMRNRKGGDGFRFFVHDSEFTLGSSYSENDRTGPYVGSNQGNFLYANPQWIHQDLMASAEYRRRFADRVQKHFFRGGALTEDACRARFLRRANEVREALKAHAARWADARYAASYNIGMWEAEINRVTQSWMPGRSAVVLGQLRAQGLFPDVTGPTFLNAAGSAQPDGVVPNGFVLRLSDPNGPGGTIYYTLDGTDPRTIPPPTITATLVDYTAPRSYRVPTSATDGFDTELNLSAQPLAYYSFDVDARDEATGNGALDGVLLNGASITADARVGSGALLLDGVDDYVLLGDPVELQITGEISLAAWVRATAVPSQIFGNIIAKGHWFEPNSEIFFRYGAHIDSWIVASWDGEVHGADVAGASADIGQWVHLVGTYDGTHWNLYRNGVLAASRPDPVGAIAVPNDWAIGARGTGTERFFPGFIDEVYFFDQALNATDVARLHAGVAPAWVKPDFAGAAAWRSGPGGHGYSDGGGALAPLVGTDVGAAMKGVSGSLFTRASFTATAGTLADVNYLELNAVYDGGFVAYLNGTEVCRVNAPVQLNGRSTATATRPQPAAVHTIDLSDYRGLLRTGANVLAVHSLNDAPDSPDHLMRCQLRIGRTPAGVGGTATAYAAPIPLTGPVAVSARILRQGEWGPLSTAFFDAGSVPASAQNLVVSQIHYHPVTSVGDPREGKEYEFLEIMNIGPTTIDLSGVRVRDDISFDFPANAFLAPGARAQIVANAAAFAERYTGRPTRVLGVYAGSLANEGGRLVISSDRSGIIRDFSFDDDHPWPNLADGDGFGLVLVRPASNPDHGDPANWRSSAAIHAQPGESDTTAFAGNPVADADGDGLTAFIEYAMGTSDTEATPDPWMVGPDGFSITRRINADDVTWIVETSDDLVEWSADPSRYARTSRPGAQPSIVHDVYRLNVPSTTRHRFLRVRVSQR